MSTEHPQDGPPAQAADPLAQITLTPRRFAAVLVAVALLLGLVLALVPVRVANPDPTAGSVTCGNTVGGVETRWITDDLRSTDRPTVVSYIGICEEVVGDRGTTTLVLLTLGVVGGLALTVVRWRVRG